ncbi:MAG: hypothetical protein HZB26_11465 [Candidatus Hydrogenedentes bacterium]|nr:hypothetical protein [Candidatus Hydrogenedentota bacterium]
MAEIAKQILARARALGLDRALALLFVALAFLLVIQGCRFVAAAVSSRGLADRVRSGIVAPERTERKALNEYDPIMDKGLLGKRDKGGSGPGSASAVNVFGILGSKALLGASANDAKLYSVGADIPGGEKLVEIGNAEVVLEKDGKRRTVKVFPTSPSTPPAASPVPDARPNAGLPGPQEPVAAMPVAAAPVVIAPATLNAQTLSGTSWQGGGHTVNFNADGTMKVDGQVDGTWSVDGSKVKLSVAGENVELDIQGDTLIFQGQALSRQ